MTTAPSLSTDDPNALAARAVARDGTAEQREDASLRLRPFIERQVRRLCVRFSGQTRLDLLDDAVAIIWEALTHFEAGRPFEPWCRAVLKNSTIDRLRRSSHDPLFVLGQEAEAIPDHQCRLALETALERNEPLPAADVENMDGWPPRDRVVLGCLSGVWRKVPNALWARWLDEFRDEYGFPAPGGFPPDAFETKDIHDRSSLLAELLGQKLNTLRVWIHRGRQRLCQLAWVKERILVREEDL